MSLRIAFCVEQHFLLYLQHFFYFRLKDYDRNDNFGVVVGEPDTSFRMALPDEKLYRDLISSTTIPGLQTTAVDTYLDPMGVTLNDGRNLYDATWVLL